MSWGEQSLGDSLYGGSVTVVAPGIGRRIRFVNRENLTWTSRLYPPNAFGDPALIPAAIEFTKFVANPPPHIERAYLLDVNSKILQVYTRSHS